MALKENGKVVEKEKTAPEKKKRKPRSSWKPANIMEIPKEFQDPNFVYYCVDKARPGRLMQKLREGWVIDKDIVPKMRTAGYLVDLPGTLQDGSPKDDTLQFRELIVVKMPKELAEEREEYYRSINPLNNQLGDVDEDFDAKAQGRGYGDIEIN